MALLENAALRVLLHDDLPVVTGYRYKPSGRSFGGAEDGRLAVNGASVPWSAWSVRRTDPEPAAVEYTLEHAEGWGLSFRYVLGATELRLTVRVLRDGGSLKTLDFVDFPLLRVTDEEPRASCWREEGIRQSEWTRDLYRRGGAPGIYSYYHQSRMTRVCDAVPDRAWEDAIHACIFDGTACAFVHSNQAVLPLRSRYVESARLPGRVGAVEIGPNVYHYRLRAGHADPVELRVVFLGDTNGDGSADECDYFLWLNRSLPAPHPVYRERLWYKICCSNPFEGVMTRFDEALEVICAIHNVTDGLPQMVYLVGWQDDQDPESRGGFGFGVRAHPAAGGDAGLRELFRAARSECGAAMSYHLNVDEAWDEAWDPEVLCRHPDGSPVVWYDLTERDVYEAVFPGKRYEGAPRTRVRALHVNHTKHVESGRLFPRVDRILNAFPPDLTVHLDAFRNTNPSWEPDGTYIGIHEEYACGLATIVKHFRARGLDVSTEGINGMPIEAALTFTGMWHNGFSQIYHGKLVGGGFSSPVAANASAWAFGAGVSVDTDISYRKAPFGWTLSLEANWLDIVDTIYCGTMLYRYFLEREMLELRRDGERIRVRYDDGTLAEIDRKAGRVLVRNGEVVIAEGFDRFVPFADEIVAFSRQGTDRAWTLPAAWRGVPITLHTLGREGRGPAPRHELTREGIRIDLAPHVPVKICKT